MEPDRGDAGAGRVVDCNCAACRQAATIAALPMAERRLFRKSIEPPEILALIEEEAGAARPHIDEIRERHRRAAYGRLPSASLEADIEVVRARMREAFALPPSIWALIVDCLAAQAEARRGLLDEMEGYQDDLMASIREIARK